VRLECRINGKQRVGVKIRRHQPVVREGTGSFYAVFQGNKPRTGKWGKVVKPLGDDANEACHRYQNIVERLRRGLRPDEGPVERLSHNQDNPLLRTVPFERQTHSGAKWNELFLAYQTQMRRDKQQGVFAESTEKRYLRSLRKFDLYLKARCVSHVKSITPDFIEEFRSFRVDEGAHRAGVVDTTVLHVLFEFAMDKKMLDKDPLMVKKQRSRVGKAKSNSKSFSADEIEKLRKNAAGTEDELLFFTLLRTGLRASDVMDLRSSELANGRVIKMPKKPARRTSAVVSIPMQPDLRTAVEAERKKRNPGDGDFVVLNPNTGRPFVWTRLYERCQKLGPSAGVAGVNRLMDASGRFPGTPGNLVSL